MPVPSSSPKPSLTAQPATWLQHSSWVDRPTRRLAINHAGPMPCEPPSAGCAQAPLIMFSSLGPRNSILMNSMRCSPWVGSVMASFLEKGLERSCSQLTRTHQEYRSQRCMTGTVSTRRPVLSSRLGNSLRDCPIIARSSQPGVAGRALSTLRFAERGFCERVTPCPARLSLPRRHAVHEPAVCQQRTRT